MSAAAHRRRGLRAGGAIAIAVVVAAAGGAGACKKSGDSAGGGAAATEGRATGAAARDPRVGVPLPAGAVRVEGKNFHVDAAALGPCAPDALCTVAADLTAINEFKVNKEYPFKFVAEPGLALDGPATFAHTGVHSGRLLVQFKRPAGAVTVRGGFKLSVCSADVCQVETAQLAVNVP